MSRKEEEEEEEEEEDIKLVKVLGLVIIEKISKTYRKSEYKN